MKFEILLFKDPDLDDSEGGMDGNTGMTDRKDLYCLPIEDPNNPYPPGEPARPVYLTAPLYSDFLRDCT